MDPYIQYEAPPFNGPQAAWASLGRWITAAPFEGVWVPTKFLKYGSLVVDASGVVASINGSILASNAPELPLNTYTVTVGGTVTTSDPLALIFANPNLPGGSITVSYVALGPDTTTTIATALAAAINGSAALAAQAIIASSVGPVVTITFPSQAAATPSSSFSPSNTPPPNQTALTETVGGSATEMLAIGLGTDGQVISSVTGLGFIQLSPLPRWMKFRLATLTGTSPIVSANFNGVA